MEQIIEEEQTHRVQVAALSQMQLQAIERVEVQEKDVETQCPVYGASASFEIFT